MIDKTTAPAMTLAYVVKGFWEAVHTQKLQHYTNVAESEIGLTSDIIEAAAYCEVVWLTIDQDDNALVWDYEVSEPFGAWLATYFDTERIVPSEATCIGRIMELIKQANTKELK